MTPEEAIAEAQRLESDARDCAVLIAWRDDTLDTLRVEILVVKGSRSKVATSHHASFQKHLAFLSANVFF